MITKEKLHKYCDEKGLFVPAGASKEMLEATIVRASLHLGDKLTSSCFGFWEYENAVCVTCDHERACSTASLGMDKETYFKKLEKAENPRLRFAERKLKK